MPDQVGNTEYRFSFVVAEMWYITMLMITLMRVDKKVSESGHHRQLSIMHEPFCAGYMGKKAGNMDLKLWNTKGKT